MPKKLEPSSWKVNVPAGMKALAQWVGWSAATGRKTPKDLRNGKAGKANDPSTWSTWEDACRWYERHQRDPHKGCGFVFRKGSGLVFVDVDDCLEENDELKDWAQGVVGPLLEHSYAEKSPGGKGLHLFLIASLPPGTTRSGATWKVDPKNKSLRDSVAVFDDRRFSTVTGDVYKGFSKLSPAQAQLDLLLSRTGLDKRLGPTGTDDIGEDQDVTPETVEQLKAALLATDPDLPHDQWVKIGMALKDGLGDLGFQMWDEWSRRGGKYKSGETRAKWASFQGQGVGLGSVFHVAEEEGGFTLRTKAEDDFKSFKDLPEDDGAPSERYEGGSLAKWRALGLILVAKGAGKTITVKPAEGDANVGIYFEQHLRWKGQLRFNERTCEVESLDGEALDLHEMLRHCVAFMGWSRSPSEDSVFRAATAVARKNSYDPVREWLRDLKWDKQERILPLLATMGLEDTEMTRRHMRRWLIGAVARAFKPGCRFQTMLVLYGPQGKKKSEFFRRLAVRDEWYSESQVDMTSKDGQLQLLGPWIVENGELAGMHKAEVEKVKVFISEPSSRFREPYAKKATNHPRRCALSGTTNETEGFLRDPTGSRRFQLIGAMQDQELHVELLDETVVEQLWAEAVVLYFKGERWWDEGSEVLELIESNQEHFEGTALDGYVQAVLVELRDRAVTTVQEVTLRLAEKFRVPPQTRSRDIAAAMKRAGWERAVLRVAGTQRRFWTSPKAQPEFLQKAAEQAHARIDEAEFSKESTE